MDSSATCKEPNMLSDSHSAFALDLYSAVSKSTAGNIFFSPFSISVAMAMTHLGARGKTEQELRRGLHLEHDLESIKKAYASLLQDIQKPSDEYELRTSNRAYVSRLLSVLEDYSSSLENHFMASVHDTDFEKEEEARLTINRRVEDDTNNRIKDLIQPGVLDRMTRMVLVNAIFFKGLWQEKFDEKLTKEKKFWTSDQESIDVPMMSIKKKFRYESLKELGARRLAMDYKGGRLSFVIVLPDNKEGLKDIEKNLKSLKFTDVKRPESEILVELPRFKMEETLDLKSTLASLGINDLFCADNCDLSGINSDQQKLFVSKVIHKAFVEVNEEGSEAAAATAVVMMVRCALVRPEPPFIADRPFMFYILDKAASMPLFVGKVTKV